MQHYLQDKLSITKIKPTDEEDLVVYFLDDIIILI